MELQFQKQEKEIFSAPKQKTLRKSKFVGVRQRASGKWVAEIKNSSTQKKIRIWLGTFDTAEEAARAYDEAACLLRGSNTRTNFIDPSPPNSPLSLKIRNLLHQKKASSSKQNLTLSFITPTKTAIETSSKAFSISTDQPGSGGLLKKSSEMVHDEAYKPDLILRQCNGGGFEMGCSRFDDHDRPFFATEFDQAPKRMGLEGDRMRELDISDDQLGELKFEREISGSVYAMNRANEYWENVHDSGDDFWDNPMLYQMFFPS